MPSGRTIRLPVGIFNSPSQDAKPDPVVFLQGGPGGATLSVAKQILDRTPFLAERDVILFDQRGTGKAKPSLDCAESETLFLQTLNERHPRQEFTKLDDAASAKCRTRVAANAEPSAYDSVANAADLADLRRVLEYDQWNLYGVSYGTRLALNAMRDYPAGVRSVILDSVYPPQIDAEASLARDADRALSLVFQQCAADAECARSYPALDRVFSETVARLNATPATLRMSDWTKKKNYPALVDGDGFISMLFEMLYDTDSIATIPRAIYEVSNGRYDSVSQNLSYSLETTRQIAEGMYQAVECGEEAPFTTPEAIRQAAVGVRAEIADYFSYQAQAFIDACRSVWKVQPQPPVENEPVASDIPTLLLAGELDPITPPAYAEEAARTLGASTLQVFPGVGHGVVGSRYCADTMVTAFLNNPVSKPDASCVAGLPRVRFAPPTPVVVQTPAPSTFGDDQNGFAITLSNQWIVLSQRDAADRPKLDKFLADFPEHGQFVRDSVEQLDQGMILAGHDRRAGTDILATATPTLLVYRAPGAMVGRSLAQIARDQIAFLKDQADVTGVPVTKSITLAGREMQEIQAQYRAWHLGREIRVTLVNYLASSGSDLYFVQLARPSDADPSPLPGFRALMETVKLGR